MLLYNAFETNWISKVQIGYVIAGLVAFGIFVVALVCAIVFTVKKNRTPKRIFTVLSVIFILVYFSCNTLLSLSNTGEFGNILDPPIGFEHFIFVESFENDKGKKVVYDMKGEEYTYHKYLNGFMYYDVNGREYKLTTISDYEQMQDMECLDTGEIYSIECHMISDSMFYIDESGYIYLPDDVPAYDIVHNDIAEYYIDDDGNKFYSWNLINWDKDGKMYYCGCPVNELPEHDIVDE